MENWYCCRCRRTTCHYRMKGKSVDGSREVVVWMCDICTRHRDELDGPETGPADSGVWVDEIEITYPEKGILGKPVGYGRGSDEGFGTRISER